MPFIGKYRNPTNPKVTTLQIMRVFRNGHPLTCRQAYEHFKTAITYGDFRGRLNRCHRAYHMLRQAEDSWPMKYVITDHGAQWVDTKRRS